MQQGDKICVSGCTPISVSFPSSVSSGDVVLVAIFLVGSGAAVSSVADSLTSTYSSAVALTPVPGTAYYLYIFTATLSSSGSDTVTVTANTYPVSDSVWVYEVGGVTTSGALTASGSDTSCNTSCDTGATSPSTSSSVSFSADPFLLGLVGEYSVATPTAGSGFSLSPSNAIGVAEYGGGGLAPMSSTDFPMTLSTGEVWGDVGIALAPVTTTVTSTFSTTIVPSTTYTSIIPTTTAFGTTTSIPVTTTGGTTTTQGTTIPTTTTFGTTTSIPTTTVVTVPTTSTLSTTVAVTSTVVVVTQPLVTGVAAGAGAVTPNCPGRVACNEVVTSPVSVTRLVPPVVDS